MRKARILWLFLFCFSAAWAESSKNKDQVVIVEAAQPSFRVSLPSNPTTGYRWYLRPYSSQFLMLLEHRYLPPAKNTALGTGGEEEWVFQANESAFRAPMILRIRLLYAQPWEIKNGEEKIIYLITVPKE